MAFSRTSAYPETLQAQAYYMKALSHPERLAILNLLSLHGPLTVNEIARKSPLHYASVSQHLAVLRKSDLVQCTEEFPYTYYTVHEEAFDIAKQMIKEFIKM